MDVLDKLLRTGNIRTTGDLTAEAVSLGVAEDDVAFLTTECTDLDPGLALALVRDRRQRDRDAWLGQTQLWALRVSTVIITPVPPYVFDAFATAPSVTVVSLDHHAPPPPFRENPRMPVVRDLLTAMQAVEVAEAVFFDSFSVEGRLYARRAAASLIDERRLRVDARLFVHHRAHLDFEDIELSAAVADRAEQI